MAQGVRRLLLQIGQRVYADRKEISISCHGVWVRNSETLPEIYSHL